MHTIDYENGFQYRGELNASDQLHGNGTLYDPNNKILFTGTWGNGEPHNGKATNFFTKSQHHYTGMFKDGQYDGQGILRLKGHVLYEGTFEKGEYATGKEHDLNSKSTHYTKWENGFRHTGKGAQELGDGHTYIGDFKNGIEHGYGVHSDNQNRVIFTGIFNEGLYHDGNLYKYNPNNQSPDVTLLKSGKPCNHAETQQLTDGYTYTGDFLNGKPAGEGQYRDDKQNTLFKGTVENGCYVTGTQSIFNPENGTKYDLQWFNKSLRNSFGRIKHQDGSIYAGDFIHGREQGPGTHMTSENTILFKGIFNNGFYYNGTQYILDSQGQADHVIVWSNGECYTGKGQHNTPNELLLFKGEFKHGKYYTGIEHVRAPDKKVTQYRKWENGKVTVMSVTPIINNEHASGKKDPKGLELFR